MSWGTVEFSQFRELANRIREAANGEKMAQLCEDCAKNMAEAFLEIVIPLTPTGKTPDLADVIGNATGESEMKKYTAWRAAWDGYEGGELKRGWTGGRDESPAAFAKTLQVVRSGNQYLITVENIKDYALYVEEGHRQTVGRYVPAIGKKLISPAAAGVKFKEKAEMQMRAGAADAKIQKRVDAFMEELFG